MGKFLDVTATFTDRKGDIVKTPEGEPMRIGELMVASLDIIDPKATPAERRQRFWTACKIEEAMSKGEEVEIGPYEHEQMQKACDLIMNNHMFCARLQEALAEAKEQKSRKAA